MAELLVKAVSAVHADPVKDLRGSYKRGDIVVVMPDGHAWGLQERLPTFVVVRIPGVTVEQARRFADSEGTVDPFTAQLNVTRRRRWRIRWDNLPLGVRNALRDTGEVTVTWAQVRNFIENKLTSTTAPAELSL